MKISTCSPRPVLQPCHLKTHDYLVDPYVGCAHLCHYCYAMNKAESDWSEEIYYYPEIQNQLATELESIPRQSIYMGWQTDPYQPCEVDLKQTRCVLETLQSKGYSASILTKSDLILRDLDILTAMDTAAVSFSVAFDEDDTRKLLEAGTMPTNRRIRAMRDCREAGLHVSAMVCPVIPYITDPITIIEKVAPFVDKVWVYGLSILDESEPNWQVIGPLLHDRYPDQYGNMRSAVFDREHPYWTALRVALHERYDGMEFELSAHV